MLIIEPLSDVEIMVLRAYAEQEEVMIRRVSEEGNPSQKLAWHAASEALVERGALLRTKRGLLVTPEGAAALLDAVPIQAFETFVERDWIMGKTAVPAQAAASTTGQDAANGPSRGPRRSGARSSRRSRGAS